MFHVEDIHAQNIGRVTVSGDVGKRGNGRWWILEYQKDRGTYWIFP